MVIQPEVKSYFLQTLPSPVEGPHAQETTQDNFDKIRVENPDVSVTYDENTKGAYLRFDLKNPINLD